MRVPSAGPPGLGSGDQRQQVADRDVGAVAMGSAPPHSESGRGLIVVTALAARWGTEPYPPSGKTVWVECAL